MINERDEALLRQLYLVPECPTTDEVWQKWRDAGNTGTIDEVRKSLWSLPDETFAFRDFYPRDVALEERKQYLQEVEAHLIYAWQGINQRGMRIPTIEDRLTGLLILVQRNLRDVAMQGGAA